jgi:phosphatidylserine/phosphatidylglycerophosphate/cardiolipin synthase-like enzyme
MAFRVLPRALRPMRVWRLAEQLLEGVKDPEFEVLLRRIDAAPIHRGNDVAVFFEGPPAFASMCAAIAAAEREVLLEAYILKDDATGRVFVDALAAAARRGVVVRVLADAFGSSDTRPRFWRQMEERHIEVRLYHPLLPYLWYQPYRDHRKILVTDRRVECNIVALDAQVASTLERQYAVDLAHAREITLIDWNRRTPFHKLGDACARALSPAL